jgi:biopolymer transport protein ExbB
MKTRTNVIAALLCLTVGFGSNAMAATAVSLDELLEQVKQGRIKDAGENAARIKEFQANRARQQQAVADAKAEQAREERRSQTLEDRFEVNDEEIMVLERTLQERLGDLKELFGVLQQAAGDARGNFDNSLTQVQFPERSDWMTEFAQKMGQTNRLATMDEIERVWFELQREMTETGKVVTFPATVVNKNGEEETLNVTRIGAYNIVADGKYLEYVPETGRLVELQRQPAGTYTNKVGDLESSTGGINAFAIDPSRGQLLGMLVQSPTLAEYIAQGKQVGYAIIVLGIFGLAIAFWRMIALTMTSAAVSRQAKNLENPGNNPLGRVLKVAHDSPNIDIEGLELKLGEAILKETPKFNSMLPILKIISVVAPLMGLLGTVTGMIVTFQAITLYGAGDPKMMAGGISTALVTTVLGLVVAIPTVFLYTMVSGRARALSQILNEEAAGMLSERAEQSMRSS